MSPVPTLPEVPAAVHGLLAEFPDAEALLAAARRVRDAGFRRWDVHTPYPVHGMDLAMGMGRSPLGWLVAAAGLAGIVTALGLQWYTSVFEYPLITQGKPYFSWQAFIPVTFELMVLFAAFAAVFGMLALNNLPQWYHPTLKHDLFLGASDDRFFLAIDAVDEKFNLEQTRQFLAEIGAGAVVVLEE